jgi:putative ABC transport system permease protein
LRTCEQLFDTGGEYTEIQVLAESVEVVDSVVESIENEFGDDVSVMTAASAQEMVSSILGTMQAVLGGIAGISLLVAGVGIINTMTISVMERTREIGVLKAIGAKSRDVLIMFISEAVLTGIMGGAIGAISGFVLAKAVGNWINLPTAMSLDLSVLVVGFAVITCVLSGLYPAWRASNLNPVEALRYE